MNAAAMTDAAPWWNGPWVAVLGTLLGAIVGSFLTSARDRRRWGREFLAGQIDRHTSYAADVCSAVDFLELVYVQVGDAALGKRVEVKAERIDDVDAAWRDVLTRRYVYASAELQAALVKFDVARAAAVDAIARRDPAPLALSQQRLTAARLGVLDAIQKTVNATNKALGWDLLPWRRRAWAGLWRRPWYPVARMPSELPQERPAAN
ncbi:hypothetical protein [Petropleomorpha daqingensis]|uniref:Uncharacterized protein n=1 Tax=Petropleomorpha daqingensis TaxID=2026353 RepID=A0A853CGV1_9ACTN|nr:hypothetical protein [Petropleomorpha daqingensis]NYJ07184.1 hypothetical protein [Petropleomorpha daqingensis]